jgi:hypothetical protein
MNDLKRYRLSGEPKSMRLYRYKSVDDRDVLPNGDSQEEMLSLSYSDHSIFNRFGNETERIRYNAVGKLVHKNFFTYNENEKLIMHYIHDPGGVSMKHLYRYDSKGVCRGMDSYIYGFIPADFTYYSKEKNGRSQAEIYDIEGELTEITLYTNDERGNLLELKKVWADGRIVEHYISTYDDQNRETERAGLVMDFCNRMVIRFDEKENELETIYYDRENKIEKHFINEYNYDIFGNWIKKTIFLNGTIQELEEREFVYYEKENNRKV